LWANPGPEIIGTIEPHSSGVVLATKDFTADLPEDLRETEVECKTSVLKVDDKVEFDVGVHYDQLVGHPNFYRRVELSLPSALPEVTVNVNFGTPTNRGTISQPVMTVPFVLQWSGDGWLRSQQWTLYPDGRLDKAP
jgi:hypothetical protein